MLFGDELRAAILAQYAKTGYIIMATRKQYEINGMIPVSDCCDVVDCTGLMVQHRWIVTGTTNVEEFISMARAVHGDPTLEVWWAHPRRTYYKLVALD